MYQPSTIPQMEASLPLVRLMGPSRASSRENEKHTLNHGQIYLLAVAASHRRKTLGRQLCTHAIEQMKQRGVEVVEIGTGDDAFHAVARALYEGLGLPRRFRSAGYLMKI